MCVKITVLGCGSSAGVPEIGCDCAVCTSTNPRNKRSRVSVLVETAGKRLLIDTSPDLRTQALAHSIRTVDAILYTHDHADHVMGIDDVRLFNAHANATLPAFADAETLAGLKGRFPYIFKGKPERAWFRPSLEGVEIAGPLPRRFSAAGVEVLAFAQQHASVTTLGFRIGNFAYSTDANGFPEASWPALEGLDVWLVDCLRYTPSHTHSRLELTLEWVRRVQPKRTILTHMAHDFDYETLRRELPEGVEPAYDGMMVEIA